MLINGSSLLLLLVFSFFTVNESQSASGDLHYKVPSSWIAEESSSSMRVGQYKLPRVPGDSEDASLVLYYFGPGQGGSVQANIERWVGQMEQSESASATDKAKTETLTVNGLKLTHVTVDGTYVAETTPGSGTRLNKPDFRLRAAIAETPKGAYYVKFVGPRKTVEHWGQSFLEYLRSFEFK